MRSATATGPERRRISLAARILGGTALLVVAPVAVAWLMGAYDAFETRRLRAGLVRLGEGLAEQAELHGLDGVQRAAVARDVYLRVLSPDGAVISATDPALAESEFARRWWLRDAADLFFGPTGPPDLESWEAELGPPALRSEVQTVLRGAAGADEVRVTSKMLVFSRAVRPAGRAEVLYLTRISRRSVRALYDFRYQMLKLTLGLLVGALVMGGWLAYQVVGPVRRLESRVQAVMRGEAAGPLRLERSDEIGELSESFDALRARLVARAEHSTRVTEDFAHDLKSPLAAVRAAGELLEGEGDLPAARRARLARSVGAAAAHMERSMQSLLTLARLEVALMDEASDVVELGPLIAEAVAAVRAEPRADGLEWSVVGAEGRLVRGRAPRLSQALQNLLHNAAGFAEARVQIEVRVDSGRLEIQVSDDGPGVSEGNRDRVFERFFTRRPDGAGTGLGLSITRAVAEAHGGGVRLLESAPGQGARFVLWLPPNCLEGARG